MCTIDTVPKLWANTIEAHRREVRSAVVEAIGHLVAEFGLKGVSMSAIAQHAGIGRATLYKYYSDVNAALAAWHEDQVADHVDRLRAISDQPGLAHERLRRVLSTYAEIRMHSGRQAGAADLVASLHTSPAVDDEHHRLGRIVEQLIAEAAASGNLRDDVPPPELARFALSALEGAALGASRASIRRRVALVFDALAPTRSTRAPR